MILISKVNHLGDIQNRKLEDGDDLQQNKGNFIGIVNNMLSNFENLQSAVMLKLFLRYCCSFLWMYFVETQ